MTTEVAVLNRLAVALAADSASTIDTGRSRKIYNTANKIFDLSDHQPLGLMIYGNADFMGLPFELLIKEFRKTKTLVPFNTVAECVDAFIKYLEQDVQFGKQDQEGIVISVIGPRYKKIGNCSPLCVSLTRPSCIERNAAG